MANVQIRGVPDDVHSELKTQAGRAGQSLNEYLLARVIELVDAPPWPEMLDLIAEREPYTGPPVAEIIREERARR